MNEFMWSGVIIRGIGGFYYVYSQQDHRIYECKAKGIFRKDGIKPLVGDEVDFDVTDEEQLTGNIVRIGWRRSMLIRPAVANVDQALIIFAVTKPKPNLNLLDRFLIQMEQRRVRVIICFNKTDLDVDSLGEHYAEIYRAAGYDVVLTSAARGEGIDELKERLSEEITVVAGPSGVGKSTIVNLLQSEKHMETGKISEKIGRGKHTTRHTELLYVEENTFILDTPGFSSLDLFDVKKEDLVAYYPEFLDETHNCRFIGCSHISEPECGVKFAVEIGMIARERYDNYCQLYAELKDKRNY